jgi:2-polyprenyl-3-methyl-5-hydroxy-6-metoxy-1,4-benzoquinol methylase
MALVERHVDLADKRVLDAGCARGAYVEAILRRTPHVVGVEYNPSAVEAFRQRTGLTDVVRVGDIANLEFDDHSFDVVLLNEVLEHVPDDMATLRELHRVLRPGGVLALLSPNRLYPFEQHGLKTRNGRVIAHYVPLIPYVPLLVGKRLFRYTARNFWPWQLRRMVVQAGFEVTHQSYLWQTFEGLSSATPRWLRALAPVLRRLSFMLERIPGVRRLGISQALFCTRR